MGILGKPNINKLKQNGDVNSLAQALSHHAWEVRSDAAWALRELGDPRGTDYFINALQAQSAPMRANAARTLGKFGDSRAVEALTLALNDTDEDVRKCAAAALVLLGHTRAVPEMPTTTFPDNEPQPNPLFPPGQESVSSALPSEGPGFWVRALARVIDLVLHNAIVLCAYLITGVIIGITAALTGEPPDPLVQRLSSISLMDYVWPLLGYTLYHTLCEGLHGASLGKLICGLVVVAEQDSPCNLGAAGGRSLAVFIDGLFFGLVAAASMNASRTRQRLGDKWFHTVVVKRRDLQPTQLRSGWRFVVVFLGAVIVDGGIVGFSMLLKLTR